MKEKEAQLKEKLLQNIQEVNGTKVIKFCAAMIPADTVKNIAFQLRGEITENLFFVAGNGIRRQTDADSDAERQPRSRRTESR